MPNRTPDFDFVLSVENNPYQVWQAMLFHFSCWTHQRRTPLVVVHKGDEPLLEGFERIVAAGGRVQAAPNFRDVDGYVYPPRNTPATLRFAETEAEYVVLCEPDMVFLQPMSLERAGMTPQRVSFDRLTYLDADWEEYQPALDEVCRQFGLDPQLLRTRPINGGVPHILPARLKSEISELWMHGLELFVQLARELAKESHAETEINWVSGMWSTVLAIHRLGLEPVFTEFCLPNEKGTRPMPPIDPGGPAIIHYCYGGDDFNKRDYLDLKGAMERVWRVAPDDGTINGAIRGQLLTAREFYEL